MGLLIIIGELNIIRWIVCEHDTVRLSCTDGNVIHILSAMYGGKKEILDPVLVTSILNVTQTVKKNMIH